MRENAHLVDAVHLLGADLVLNGRAARTDHGGVQALVAVGFGNGDEVLEAPVHGFVEFMQGAEREVALLPGTHDHAKAVDVQNVRKRRMRVTHAVVDTVDCFVASLNLRNDMVLGKHFARFPQNPLKHRTAFAAGGDEVFSEYFVAQRMLVEKGELLQFTENRV